MEKGTKDNIGCLIAIAAIAVVVGLICIGITALMPPDENKAEKVFNKDRELLETVVCYLENSGYESVYIHKTMSVDGIEDEAVVKAIDQIFKRGYDAIGRRGNTICFLRWTRLKDFGSGIAYSINGEDEPVIEYLIKLEPLSEVGWYYYEEN